MKKPLLKSKSIGLGLFSQYLRLLVCLLVIGWSSNVLQAQTPDCNIIMACNDNIQVSLGEDCSELLVPDMILEDPAYPDNFFTVTLWRESGAVVLDNTLRQSMIGETLSARVRLNGCAISCWGNLTVEDKLPPVLTNCPSPIEVECKDSTEPGDIPTPTATDACTSVDLEHFDTVEKLLCDQPYTMTITRDWIATDQYGNSATCQQVINVFRASISDVTFPVDFADSTAIECGAAIVYLDSGAPSPVYTGYPDGVECPNINYYYDDIIFELCGNGIKVLRQWNVLDWCSGRDTMGNQVIKVLDTMAPVCMSSNVVHEISTSEGKCTGGFNVPEPNVTFECSDYDYIVGYKLKDNSGNPYEGVSYDHVQKISIANGATFYRILELPQDTIWIVYTITDACGHVSQCYTVVSVVDDEKPSAICEGYSIVTIGTDGWADIEAYSIDDYSKDNCEIKDYKIRRLEDNCGYPSDLEFGDHVNFCCEDVSDDPNHYIKVVLRVTDVSGNYNDCVANVKVQDKIDPTITCPPIAFVECSTGSTVPSSTGFATGTDNCEVDITFNDNDFTNNCGIGYINRIWTAEDPGGRKKTCVQRINIEDSVPFSIDDVNFPNDITINGCTEDDADPLITGSLPTYSNDDCADIAVSYDDEYFEIQGACMLINRSWRLADWCNYNPQNPNYITGVQKITLINTQPPNFISSCGDRVIESQDNDCEGYVEHRAEAQDDCTPASQIVYRWEYDEDNDGVINDTGYGPFTANVYPEGTHRFTFYAIDLCDNEASCSYTFRITDAKAPTPICHSEIVWVLDEYGDAEVWASDFNLKSTDLCDNDDNLIFSFNAEGTMPAMSFDCSDVPNGIAQEIDLEMHVIDSDGNSEYCEVTLILQDSPNKDACIDDPGAMGRIAGDIFHHTHEGLKNVDVLLIDDVSDETVINPTDGSGHFEFDQAAYYGMYSIAPQSNSDILNGVSTLDLVHIQRHILGIDELDQPINLIAADVNADNKVSASDLVALRKVILGITNEYQNNNSWRFVPTNYEFLFPEDPWDFPESIEIENMMLDDMDNDFTSIKIGDVNLSSKANANEEEVDNRSAGLHIAIDEKQVKSGSLVEIPVYADDHTSLSGLQLDLLFEGYDFDFVGIEAGVLKLQGGDFYVEGNRIRISHASTTIQEVEQGDVLFTLNMMAKTNTSTFDFDLNREGLPSESYDHNLESGRVTLEVRSHFDFDERQEEVVNTPNPFSHKTNIHFEMDVESELMINIFDVTGKNILSKTQDGFKGLNTIPISSEELSDKPGVYLFKIDTGSKVYSGKMILTM
jgi:hypothetical protein